MRSRWAVLAAGVAGSLLPPNLAKRPVEGPWGRAQESAIVRSEFVFTTAPFASAHASTLVETDDGVLAAWFGGSQEGAPDVAVWAARFRDGAWAAPTRIATGLGANGTRYPCWNPVLFRLDAHTLWLFYKVGPSPARWWGMVASSHDDGVTWDPPTRLPAGILGPIKNKPVRLGDGTILSPSSTESPETPARWRIHFERSTDAGRTWTTSAPPEGDGAIDAIQPSILSLAGDTLEAVGRTRSGRVFRTWSPDGGRHWSPLVLTALPNPNAGLDAATLRDGRHLIVYNHTDRGRTPLNVAVSPDGRAWRPVAVLEHGPGEYSYPAVIQTRDGLVHITYTWRRARIKHVTLDPRRLDPANR